MKKNFKVVRLNGMTGLFLIITAVVVVLGCILCLPVYGIKFLWNEYLSGYFNIQTIRLSQSSLLWFAIVAIIYAQLKKKIRFKFVDVSNMSESQINSIDYEQFVKQVKEEQKEDEKINH